VLPEQPDQPLSAKGSKTQQPVGDAEVPAAPEIPNDVGLSDEEDEEELQDPEDVEVQHHVVFEFDSV
jgi:hypothetical protein